MLFRSREGLGQGVSNRQIQLCHPMNSYLEERASPLYLYVFPLKLAVTASYLPSQFKYYIFRKAFPNHSCLCGIYTYIWGFPGSSAGTESTCNSGDHGSIPGLGRSPGEGKGYPLQYSGLENSTEWRVHGVAVLGCTPAEILARLGID